MKPTRTRPPRRPTFESAHDATPRMVKIRLKIKPLRAQVPSSVQIIHTGTEQNRTEGSPLTRRKGTRRNQASAPANNGEHAERGGENSKTGSRRRNSPPLAGGRSQIDVGSGGRADSAGDPARPRRGGRPGVQAKDGTASDAERKGGKGGGNS